MSNMNNPNGVPAGVPVDDDGRIAWDALRDVADTALTKIRQLESMARLAAVATDTDEQTDTHACFELIAEGLEAASGELDTLWSIFHEASADSAVETAKP